MCAQTHTRWHTNSTFKLFQEYARCFIFCCCTLVYLVFTAPSPLTTLTAPPLFLLCLLLLLPSIPSSFFFCYLKDREEDVRSCRIHTTTRCGTATPLVSSVLVCASHGIHTSCTIHAYKPRSTHVQALGSKRKVHDGPTIPQQSAPLPS